MQYENEIMSLTCDMTDLYNTSLDDILCLETDRTVQHDNTVRYNALILQIPKNEYRYNYVKSEVKVREYIDHHMAVFYGPLCIGRYDASGKLKTNDTQEADTENTKKHVKAA